MNRRRFLALAGAAALPVPGPAADALPVLRSGEFIAPIVGPLRGMAMLGSCLIWVDGAGVHIDDGSFVETIGGASS